MIDITDFSVMPSKCSTCPFKVDENGRYPDPYLVGEIQTSSITDASQICHHPTLTGQKQTHLCRGARNWQLQVFYRLGVLESPTDEAWNLARNKNGK